MRRTTSFTDTVLRTLDECTDCEAEYIPVIIHLLARVLAPEPVRTAYHGIILTEERLKSFALEYLEQVLPDDIKQKLWPFIGDISEFQRQKATS